MSCGGGERGGLGIGRGVGGERKGYWGCIVVWRRVGYCCEEKEGLGIGGVLAAGKRGIVHKSCSGRECVPAAGKARYYAYIVF